MGRRLDRRLAACGASRVGPLGEGDDDGSMEEDYLKWKAKALPQVAAYFKLSEIDKTSLPHVPLFNVVNMGRQVTPDLAEKMFCGEISSGDPRRWGKLNIAPSEDFVESKADETFVEIKYVVPLIYIEKILVPLLLIVD